MFKSKKILMLLTCLLVLSFTLVACGSNKPAAEQKTPELEVIKIGVFEPLTGGNAAGGQMTLDGIKLANELYPEVNGKKVQLFIADNKSDKAEAPNAMAKLLEQDKVNVVIGSYGSSLSMAGGQVAKDKKVPVIGCSPTNPLVTLGNEYYFRVCFIDPFQGTVMANYAFNEIGAKTAAIIQDKTSDYSVGLSKYFKDAFVKFTGNENSVITIQNYNTGDKDFTAQLTAIKDLNPDVIFAPGNFGESALLIKQARELKIETPFLGGDTWEATEFVQIGGAAVEGAVFSTHFTAEAPVTKASEEFLAKYKAKYNQDANAFAALGYDAYMLALDAIKKANSSEPQAITDALAKTAGFEGATGVITLDTNGDATKSAIINKVQDGKFVYLTTVNPK